MASIRNDNRGTGKIIAVFALMAVFLCFCISMVWMLHGTPTETGAESSQTNGQQAADQSVESFKPENSETQAEITLQEGSLLTVHFLDVGQGACTLLVCDGEAMLIDGGGEDTATVVQLYLKKQNIDRINYVVATHPDADHIGGLDVVIYKFDCGTILAPDTENDTTAYGNYLAAIESKGADLKHPQVGESFRLGSAECTILGPLREYDSGNDNSLVLLVSHGEKRFVFSGDAEAQAEKELAAQYPTLQADVYMAAHHGSKSSSSAGWLKVLQPIYTVISCGAGNRDGHPHEATLTRLAEIQTLLFRTDLQGTIVAESDGKNISWSCAPTDNYQPGNSIPAATESTENTQDKYGTAPEGAVYIGNIKNMKLHLASCDGLPQSRNQIVVDTLEEAVRLGFTEEDQCKRCLPFSQ